MDIEKETIKVPVLVLDKSPEVNDKWEDEMNIYTVTSVKGSPLNFNTGVDHSEHCFYHLFDVNVEVWNKFECQGDEPEHFLAIVVKKKKQL